MSEQAPIPLQSTVRLLVGKCDALGWALEPGALGVVVEVYPAAAGSAQAYRVVLSDMAGRQHDGHTFDVLAHEVVIVAPVPPSRRAPDLPPFPDPDDAARGRWALRFEETHDWDGSTAYHKCIELHISQTGAGCVLVWNTNTFETISSKPFTEASEACRLMFERLADLKPATFREQIGGSQLDTTYEQRLTIFDGAHLRRMVYVWGRERGIGTTSDTRTPPEREAFAIALDLVRRHR